MNSNDKNLTPYLELRKRAESLMDRMEAIRFHSRNNAIRCIAFIEKAKELADGHDYDAASVELDSLEKIINLEINELMN
jgi:hypothetical protein